MKRSMMNVVGLAILISLFTVGCALPGSDGEVVDKFTMDVGPELDPSVLDRGLVMGDNNDPRDSIVPPQSEKIQADAVRSRAYGTAASIAVPHYYQETSYWCGPASAQMIQYYFAMGCSQSRIASFCGTTSTSGTSIYELARWFNTSPMTGYARLPSWWKWEVEYLDSYQEFLDCMGTSFYNYKAPEIWNVRTYPSSTYHLPGYTFNGRHYVTGKGYDSTYAIYNDPWYGSGGGPGRKVGKYTMYYCIISNHRLIIY